ncbi:MAG: hemolysin III family protein [Micromonosporaceae bacterium]|nr:hemolysin III family protein [Micromonosporaceae bacterium]
MTTAVRLRPADLGKPRMRGWLHTYGFVVALAAGAVLCGLAATRPDRATLVSCVIYSVSVAAMFGVSALYHRRVWSRRGFALMRRLDHATIFLFIAGTYTPFSVLLLPADRATVILAVVWGGAVAGAAMKLVWPHAPRWASAPLYVALGWVAVAVLPDLLRAGGVAVLVLLLLGGVTYTAGAVGYALRWPTGWPRVFGHHEFFHAATLLAALAHHVAVYLALYA